jgi:hypothetical protein
MADVKKGSDLITTLGETEKRLKKVERQLAVPRKGASSIVTEQSTVGTGTESFANETVTVVTTANCLIHFFLQMDAKTSSASAPCTVRIESVETSERFVCFEVTSLGFRRFRTAPGTGSIISADFTSESGVSPATFNSLRGGVLTVASPLEGWATSAGPHEFTISYNQPTSGETLTVKNRKFFAWVQPF